MIDNSKIRDNIVKWCEALESGDYQQGRDVLKSHSGYCCLGVACNIINDKWSYNALEKKFSHELGRSGDYEDKWYYLSNEGRSLFGLTIDDQTNLTRLNDQGSSFLEIAAYIRKNILIRYADANADQQS